MSGSRVHPPCSYAGRDRRGRSRCGYGLLLTAAILTTKRSDLMADILVLLEKKSFKNYINFHNNIFPWLSGVELGWGLLPQSSILFLLRNFLEFNVVWLRCGFHTLEA